MLRSVSQAICSIVYTALDKIELLLAELGHCLVMRMASYHKADEDSERDVPHRDAERGYFEVAETEKFSVALESTTQGAAMLAFAQWSDAEYASKYGQKQAATACEVDDCFRRFRAKICRTEFPGVAGAMRALR